MSDTVPPPPYKSPVITPQGFLTDVWSKWFRQVFSRIGGSVALSNTQLEALPAASLATVNSRLSALEITSASNTTRITTLESQVSALNQGPTL